MTADHRLENLNRIKPAAAMTNAPVQMRPTGATGQTDTTDHLPGLHRLIDMQPLPPQMAIHVLVMP